MNTRFPAVLTASLLLATCAGTAALAAQSGEAGVWVRHDIRFDFLPYLTTYSCDGLADKLHVLLSVSGARQDARVRAFGCSRGPSLPDRFASARLIFYTLMPGEASAAKAAGNQRPVMGEWKTVRMAIRPKMDLQPGDCELIEQFQHKVLRQAFAVRKVRAPSPCPADHPPIGGYNLSFQVFVPAASPAPRPAH